MNEIKISTYKVLIIGCGNIAGGFDSAKLSDGWPLTHAGAFQKHGSFEITACVDVDLKQLTSFRQYWGVKKFALSLLALDARPGDFDVISICSPTFFHQEHLREAISLQPRVIFCEKPLTLSINSSQRVVDECCNNGITLVVNYSREWDPSVEHLITDLRAGAWGDIRSIVAHYNKGIRNNGGHFLNLISRLLGDLKVLFVGNVIHDYWDNDPTVAVMMSNQDGTVPIYMNPGNASDYAYFELDVICEKGVIRMKNGGLNWEFRKVQHDSQYVGYKTLQDSIHCAGEYRKSLGLAISEIYNHLETGSTVRCTGMDALHIDKLCQDIIEKIR